MGNKHSKKYKNKNDNKIKTFDEYYNIGVIGMSGVGKTTFMNKVFGQSKNYSFDITSNEQPTKTINVPHKIVTHFTVTENNDNNEHNKFVDNIYFNNNLYWENNLKKYKMIILIYDISDPQSFQYCKKYIDRLYDLTFDSYSTSYPNELKNNMINKKILFVGNKLDKVQNIRGIFMGNKNLESLMESAFKENDMKLYNEIKLNKQEHQFVMKQVGINYIQDMFVHEFVETSCDILDSDYLFDKFVNLLAK